MLLNKVDEANIRAIVQSQGFEAVKRVAQILMDEWTRELPFGDDQFLYLKSSLERDGKLMGTSRFIKELEKIAHNKP